MLGPFSDLFPKFQQKSIFLEKRALLVFKDSNYLPLGKKLEKTNDQFLVAFSFKECIIETEGTICPILYFSWPIRLQIFCMLTTILHIGAKDAHFVTPGEMFKELEELRSFILKFLRDYQVNSFNTITKK